MSFKNHYIEKGVKNLFFFFFNDYLLPFTKGSKIQHFYIFLVNKFYLFIFFSVSFAVFLSLISCTAIYGKFFSNKIFVASYPDELVANGDRYLICLVLTPPGPLNFGRKMKNHQIFSYCCRILFIKQNLLSFFWNFNTFDSGRGFQTKKFLQTFCRKKTCRFSLFIHYVVQIFAF